MLVNMTEEKARDWALFTSYILLKSSVARFMIDTIDDAIHNGVVRVSRLDELYKLRASAERIAAIGECYYAMGPE